MDYDEGQNPIVHLQADLWETVDWAQRNNQSWAFSDRNAGTRYAFFYNDIADIEKLNWDAIEAITWRDSLVKDGKQAEFLVLDSFPWELVEKIGVIDKITKIRVEKMVENSSHKPLVEVERSWYY